MKLAFVVDNLGPYHVARLSAVARKASVLAIEVRGASATYAWAPAVSVPFQRETLLPGGSNADPRPHVRAALNSAVPDVVFTSGWSKPADLAALHWAGQRRIPAIVMSASQAIDFSRRAPVEWLKRRMLAHVSGALVGGKPHAVYATALGILPERIRTGYDVVDNAHFATSPAGTRRGFIASARFIRKKNLPFLLRAYAAYRALHHAKMPNELPWNLTLLGDGPQRAELESLSSNLGGGVVFRGFLQYPDLPGAFVGAGAFVHASTTEQWGLVVNEAMAAGLPVLVSTRCGCVADLIEEGVNGYALNPDDEAGWAARMFEIARMPPADRSEMGAASQRIIARFTPETYAEAALGLAQDALSCPPSRLHWTNGLLISSAAQARILLDRWHSANASAFKKAPGR